MSCVPQPTTSFALTENWKWVEYCRKTGKVSLSRDATVRSGYRLVVSGQTMVQRNDETAIMMVKQEFVCNGDRRE